MKAASFLLIIFIISISSTAQNLNGVWRGTLTQGPGGCFRVYNIELNIKTENGKINGASYHYSDVTNYVKEDFGGNYNSSNKSLNINELRVLHFMFRQIVFPALSNTVSFTKSRIIKKCLPVIGMVLL